MTDVPLAGRLIFMAIRSHRIASQIIRTPSMYGGLEAQEASMGNALHDVVLIVAGHDVPQWETKAWRVTARAFGTPFNSPASSHITEQSVMTDFLRTWSEYTYEYNGFGDVNLKWDQGTVLRLMSESDVRSILET
jgi:hypothetical protein